MDLRMAPLVLAALTACASSPATKPCPAVTSPPSPLPLAAPETLAVRAAGFSFAIHARPLANLAYALDCLTGDIPCTEEAFHAFWDQGWTPADAAALAEWKSVREMYSVSSSEPDPEPDTPLPLPDAAVDFDARVRLAGLMASNLDEYRHDLAVLLPPTDIDRLANAAAHFLPRFEAFWGSSGRATAERFGKALRALLEKGELPAMLSRAARFYATPLREGSPLDFDLVVVPGASDQSSGQQILGHGVVEIHASEGPDDRMDVVCHELFHYFFSTRSKAQQASLMRSVLASPDSDAELAYALLNESMATALGNGVVGRIVNPAALAREMTREGGLYGVHSIDATAKGLLARTHGDPTTGSSLDSPEVIAALIASARDAVGAEPAPREYLRVFTGATEPGWWATSMKAAVALASSNDVHGSSPVGSTDSAALVKRHTALPVVLVVTPSHLSALSVYGDALSAEGRRTIAQEAKKKGPFVYAERRGKVAWIFVVVGETPAEAKTVIDPFFALSATKGGVFRPPS